MWKIRKSGAKCEKGGGSATQKEEKTMSSGQKQQEVGKEHCPI